MSTLYKSHCQREKNTLPVFLEHDTGTLFHYGFLSQLQVLPAGEHALHVGGPIPVDAFPQRAGQKLRQETDRPMIGDQL